MKTKLILTIIFIIFVSFFLLQSSSFSTNTTNSNDCNSCHGPSDPAHIAYGVSLGISQTILNGTTSTLTATIVNNGYQLSSTSISLQSSGDFIYSPINSGDTASKSLGTLSTGSTNIVTWHITPMVNANKTIMIQTFFQGTAINHKTNTYTNTYSKSVYVSTEKIALLQVSSNPISESTFLAGSNLLNSSLTVSNTGILDMQNVLVNTSGNIFVDNKPTFIIPKISPGQSFSYPIHFNTSISGQRSIFVTYLNSTPLQEVVITIIIQPVPPVSYVQIIGSILGFITYILLFLSVVAGAGIYHLKKYISGRKIRIIHSDLANLSFTIVVIHGVILSLPTSPWYGTYSWFQLVPQIVPFPATAADWGLELGRWTLVLLYIGVISGYYISKIIKKFGRKVGISIHMLTYLGLVLGAIHAILIGTFAKTFILIPIILFVSIVSVGWLKYDIKVQMAKKKAERLRKHPQPSNNNSLNRLKPSQTQPGTISYPVQNSANPFSGEFCPRCSTLNDGDAFFCKRCGIELWRKK